MKKVLSVFLFLIFVCGLVSSMGFICNFEEELNGKIIPEYCPTFSCELKNAVTCEDYFIVEAKCEPIDCDTTLIRIDAICEEKTQYLTFGLEEINSMHIGDKIIFESKYYHDLTLCASQYHPMIAGEMKSIEKKGKGMSLNEAINWNNMVFKIMVVVIIVSVLAIIFRKRIFKVMKSFQNKGVKK